MRLAQNQTLTIVETARQFAGAEAEVIVFGSRVDDTRKGGDVDLMIEAPERPGIWRQAQLVAELEKRLGLPVDLVVHAANEPERSIHRIARLTGVRLT